MTAEFKFFRGIKNASCLAAGNIISQIISFVGVIYIARLLGPDDYGVYVTVGLLWDFLRSSCWTG